MPGTVPPAYAWVAVSVYENAGHPRMVNEALKEYGVREAPGGADNSEIVAWAREVGLAQIYVHDSEAWCGLFMAVCAKRAGKQAPHSPLWALSWADFGRKSPEPSFGDVLVFRRTDGHGHTLGGHVALYVGEDQEAFHCLGGNQGNAVSIVRVSKDRIAAVRRPAYTTTPLNAVPMHLDAHGALSVDEA
jgi:uncharacterized protein (TIGR02594 family)